MPPVADTDLMSVVDDLLDRNTNGIATVAELARRMAEVDGRQNSESWRKALRRWRTRGAKEADIAVVARAFGVARASLPPAKAKPTVADVDRRLARLEVAVGAIPEGQTAASLLEELAGKLADAMERLDELEARRGLGAVAPKATR